MGRAPRRDDPEVEPENLMLAVWDRRLLVRMNNYYQCANSPRKIKPGLVSYLQRKPSVV
jgi:hypothetical protein